MSKEAFRRVMQGLEEAKAYEEGEREGYKVTVPSPAKRNSWAELRATMPQESQARMDERLQATLAPWIRRS